MSIPIQRETLIPAGHVVALIGCPVGRLVRSFVLRSVGSFIGRLVGRSVGSLIRLVVLERIVTIHAVIRILSIVAVLSVMILCHDEILLFLLH